MPKPLILITENTADDAPEICDSCWCDGRPKMAAATARKDAAPAAGKG